MVTEELNDFVKSLVVDNLAKQKAKATTPTTITPTATLPSSDDHHWFAVFYNGVAYHYVNGKLLRYEYGKENDLASTVPDGAQYTRFDISKDRATGISVADLDKMAADDYIAHKSLVASKPVEMPNPVHHFYVVFSDGGVDRYRDGKYDHHTGNKQSSTVLAGVPESNIHRLTETQTAYLTRFDIDKIAMSNFEEHKKTIASQQTAPVASIPPMELVGGDLSGTYPTPTVKTIVPAMARVRIYASGGANYFNKDDGFMGTRDAQQFLSDLNADLQRFVAAKIEYDTTKTLIGNSQVCKDIQEQLDKINSIKDTMAQTEQAKQAKLKREKVIEEAKKVIKDMVDTQLASKATTPIEINLYGDGSAIAYQNGTNIATLGGADSMPTNATPEQRLADTLKFIAGAPVVPTVRFMDPLEDRLKTNIEQACKDRQLELEGMKAVDEVYGDLFGSVIGNATKETTGQPRSISEIKEALRKAEDKWIAETNGKVISGTELDTNIKHLNDTIKTIDSELKKTIQDLQHKVGEKDIGKQVAQRSPTKYEFLFNPDDLRALEKMLDDIEHKARHQTEVPPPTNHNIEPPKQTAEPPLISQEQKQALLDYRDQLEATNFPNLSKDDTMPKNSDGWMTDNEGTEKCYKNGKLHCDNGPAEVRTNGTQLWYRNGKLHRDGGEPAMIGASGTQKFAVNGKYHRVGGQPAIIWSRSQYKYEYWHNGEIQRAVKKDGTQEWFASGSTEREDAVFSRMDGPAVIGPTGREEYWLYGTHYASRAGWEKALLKMEPIDDQLENGLIDEDPMEDAESSDEVLETTTKTRKTHAKKEEKPMTTKPSLTDMLKSNAKDAAFRVAATQSTTLVKNTIVTLMRNKGTPDGQLQGIAAFLDTEFGMAIMSGVLGIGLNYLPEQLGGARPEVARLAEEMRINGMATAGNAVVGEVLQHALPALQQILSTLPALEEGSSNIRVEEKQHLVEALEEDTEETKTETTSNIKTMKA